MLLAGAGQGVAGGRSPPRVRLSLWLCRLNTSADQAGREGRKLDVALFGVGAARCVAGPSPVIAACSHVPPPWRPVARAVVPLRSDPACGPGCFVLLRRCGRAWH